MSWRLSSKMASEHGDSQDLPSDNDRKGGSRKNVGVGGRVAFLLRQGQAITAIS